jgi:HK97 family phage prohead protease
MTHSKPAFSARLSCAWRATATRASSAATPPSSTALSRRHGVPRDHPPGAFAATLAKKPDVRLLINHDGLPLARTTSGTLKLREDKRGLHFEAELDATDPDVQRILPKVQRGDLSQMSFAFRTIKDAWRTEDGKPTCASCTSST